MLVIYGSVAKHRLHYRRKQAKSQGESLVVAKVGWQAMLRLNLHQLLQEAFFWQKEKKKKKSEEMGLTFNFNLATIGYITNLLNHLKDKKL